MNLGYSRTAGKVWALMSWKNATDPSPGDFSLRIDSQSPDEFVILKGGEKYWSSGLWDRDSHKFSLVPEMTFNNIFNFSFISTQNESYLKYLLNTSVANTSTRLVMHLSGQVRQTTRLETSKHWGLFGVNQGTNVMSSCSAVHSADATTELFLLLVTAWI